MVTLPTGEPIPGRQLLLLDTSGDRLKAAVATGNIDTANHVAVYTPGMNNNVGNMSESVKEMDQIRTDAEKMSKKGKPGGVESVAMVTWLGYQPPALTSVDEMVADVIGGQEAGDSAGKLASFYDGISESRCDDPHVTALGHSYGSLTTGIALNQPGTGVDDAVFFGSLSIAEGPPATPAELGQEIRKLQVPAGHAYTLEADGDHIADVGNVSSYYGNDPGSMPGMNQLSTHDAIGPGGQRLAAVSGRTDYTDILPDNARSTSAHNIAAVVAGMPHLTISDPG